MGPWQWGPGRAPRKGKATKGLLGTLRLRSRAPSLTTVPHPTGGTELAEKLELRGHGDQELHVDRCLKTERPWDQPSGPPREVKLFILAAQ